jgi:hypothetical protein
MGSGDMSGSRKGRLLQALIVSVITHGSPTHQALSLRTWIRILASKELKVLWARLQLSLRRQTQVPPDFAQTFRMVGKESTGIMPRTLETGDPAGQVSTEMVGPHLRVPFLRAQILSTFQFAGAEGDKAEPVARVACPLVAGRAVRVDQAPPVRVLLPRGTAAAAAREEKEALEVKVAMADREQRVVGVAQST